MHNIKNNFIFKIVDKDICLNKYKNIYTRFAPEPNGCLHIGHAKAICLNFNVAYKYNGRCNLRFDDTNPNKENIEYIESIKNDIQWLGFNWSSIHYTSEYFNYLYNYAIYLIKKGMAYVDELNNEDIKNYRGTLKKSGKNSPYRNRSIQENKYLFIKMRDGKFPEGRACLRAKIDMCSPFMIMRDPVLYRIKFTPHHQTGKTWCIYPMYDFAHCISDALEGITHSLCTLEFQDNRRLYEWILNNININHCPKQYEFSRLNLAYTVLSKRKLNILVNEKIVDGWDDPRMPTIAGLRRRGYNPIAIREFCEKIGVTKQENNIDMSMLESCIRKNLNFNAPRVMAVIDPVKVVIETLPEGYEENIIMLNHPNRPEMGTRKVVLNREIYIDRADFREKNNNKKYKRLILGEKVRLRNSYIIKANRIKKDQFGKIITIFCSHYCTTLNKNTTYDKKIIGIIHWVSVIHSIFSEFRLYNRLFNTINPSLEQDLLSSLNSNSLLIKRGFVESSIINMMKIKKFFQFEREGYFCVDNHKFTLSYPIFNRTVELREVWCNN